MAAILNHPSSEERPVPGLQNHDGKPAASNPEGQGQGEGDGEAVETGRTTDPQTSIHNALVAHVGGFSYKPEHCCLYRHGFYVPSHVFPLFVSSLYIISSSRSVNWYRRSSMPGRRMIKYSKICTIHTLLLPTSFIFSYLQSKNVKLI